MKPLLAMAVTGLAVLCSGCAATMTVSELGVNRYRLRVVETKSDQTGRVVVKADLVPYTLPVAWPGSTGKSGPARAARFVLGDPATVRASLRGSADAQGLQGLEVHVAIPSQPGWQMVPFDTQTRDAEPAMLSEEYRQVLRTPAAAPPRYRAVVSSVPRPIERHVAWWHWPAQILLVPALVFDVLTLPIQLDEFGRQVR